MQNLTHQQTQLISGGVFEPAEIQQLKILTALVIPKAILGIFLPAVGFNMNGLVGKAAFEAGLVALAAAGMAASHYYYQDNAVENN